MVLFVDTFSEAFTPQAAGATAQVLQAAGFEVDEVLDAPDRPGLEWVFVARRS